MSRLVSASRPARSETPAGLLILHHGRGADERDLLDLADILDPTEQLYVVTPRAPLELPGLPGFHWYVVPRVGYPDSTSFAAAFRALAEFHDEVRELTGVPPERTILGGFSMGAVMSYALGLAPDRPAPAGIMAFSGFVPTVPGWQPAVVDRAGMPVFIAHGRRDRIIEIRFAREARDRLRSGGLDVDYHEHDGTHQIVRMDLDDAANWLGRALNHQAAATAPGQEPRTPAT